MVPAIKTRSRRTAISRGSALVAVSALALAACSSGGGSGEGGEGGGGASTDAAALDCAVEDFAADEQFRSPEPMEVSMLWTDWPESPIKDTWQLFDKIEELTNVRIVTTNIPFSDAVEKRGLLISAGDAPTAIPLMYTGDERQFAASGAALPLSDYSEYMPNFNKYVDEWDLREGIDNLRQSDGKYYMTPGLQEVSVPMFTLVIRKDVFEEVGAPIPETWEEVQEGLELIKAKYPDSKPLADGFEGASMLNYAAHAFGTVAGWGFGQGVFYNESADEFEYAPTTEGYKDMLTYFNGLVEKDLLDTESFTAPNDGTGTVTEKFAAEKVFAASGGSWTVNEFATALDAAGVTDYELLQIAPPGGEAGQIVEPRNFWHGFMLTSQAEDDPNLCSTIQFMDWLYYNQDARELLQWGVEGETYDKADDGTITLKPEYTYKAYNLNLDTGTTDIKTDLGWGTDVLAGGTESRALKESYNQPAFVDYIDAIQSTRTPRDPFPPAPLEEMELEQASLQGTPLKDSVDTATLQFILGERDLSEYDAFVAELEGSGLSGYMDLINGAKDRWAEANS